MTIRGAGTGGKTSSKFAKKDKYVPPVPRAGAMKRRDIPASEFRRYYD